MTKITGLRSIRRNYSAFFYGTTPSNPLALEAAARAPRLIEGVHMLLKHYWLRAAHAARDCGTFAAAPENEVLLPEATGTVLQGSRG
jgi:hypothetical protein